MTLTYLSSFAQNSNNACQTVDNDFANKPFKLGTITKDNLRLLICGEATLKKTPVANNHTVHTDTIYIYKFLKSEITFYKGTDSFFMKAALIQDYCVLFANDIKIGDAREVVLMKLKITQKENCNPIRISDEEDFAHHELYFEGGKLKKIILDFGMD